MIRPCVCGTPGTPGRCVFCVAFEADDRYRRLWSGEPQLPQPEPEPSAKKTTLPDCHELDPPLAGQERFSCGRKLRGCAIHGQCTTKVPRDGVACCDTCNEHTSRKP